MKVILAAVLLARPSNSFMTMATSSAQIVRVEDSASGMLSSLRDHYRPLLVFAPTDQDQRFLRQMHLFAAGSIAMHERQVLFVPLPAERRDRAATPAQKGTGVAQLKATEAARLRLRFGITPEDFTVILLGKDGGEKFRTHNPVTIDTLNALIDAMPMRQLEVHDGHAK